MRTLWKILSRTVFWDYDRGTIPYDLMVGAVVLFVFLSPRSWFADQPQIGPPAHAAVIETVGEDAAQRVKTFRVDAHLLALPTPSRQLERETHEVLGKNVEELKGRTFQIVRIEAVRGEDGSVQFYDVSVHR